MYNFDPYVTNDGSLGLYNKEFEDIYHSAGGAITEAYEKFICPLNWKYLLRKNSIKVLDICYGIGYNTKCFLNFIFEIKKNEKKIKKLFPKKHTTAPIYTHNILNDNYNSELKNCKNLLNNIETIHTDNISSENYQKIFIKAIDNDKILTLLSPFIKNKNKISNSKNLNWQTTKFLNKLPKLKSTKIDNLVNFLIFEKLYENNSENFKNNIFSNLLNSKKYSNYYDSKLRGIFKLYESNGYKKSFKEDKLAFLHNIYYRHVSNCYKNELNYYKLQDINFTVENDDARKVILDDNNLYDVILLDAFTPSKCPCLWSYDFFKLLYNHLDENGILLTYSKSPLVRNAILQAGFHLGYIYIERENKYTGTFACKNNKLIKYPLSEFDLGALKTKAGIIYHDENLNASNEALNIRRNEEVKKSDKITNSHYNKINKEEKCNMM